MSDGKVHATASLLLAAGFSVAALATREPDLFKCAVGSLVGIFVTPDLDLSNAGIVQGALIRKRVGWFGERAWKWFWKGYSESCKHGQFMSHFPIFSTFVRLSYIYFWLIFLPDTLILRLFVPNLNLPADLLWWSIIVFEPMFFSGLAGSDFIHWCLDKLTTAHTEEQHEKNNS